MFMPSWALRWFSPSWKPRISQPAVNGTLSVVQPSAVDGSPPSKEFEGR